MARNWLRHHVDARDGQVVIRKVVVSPTVTTPSAISEVANGGSMTPEQAREMVERARKLREERQRRIAAERMS